MYFPSWDLGFMWVLSRNEVNKKRFPFTGSKYYFSIRNNNNNGNSKSRPENLNLSGNLLVPVSFKVISHLDHTKSFESEFSFTVLEFSWIEQVRFTTWKQTLPRKISVHLVWLESEVNDLFRQGIWMKSLFGIYRFYSP